MPRTLAPALVAVASSLSTPAFAHAFLVSAVPAAGSIVTTAPTVLTLNYSERVEPRFSQVQVLDAKGDKLAAGAARIADNGGRTITVTLPKLSPGSYTVIWHVTAADTHKTEGRFNFTVAP